MQRRRFMFWLGMGLFSLSEKLNAGMLDELAEKAMRSTEPPPATPPTHWRAAENNTWRWFKRETYAGGKWTVSGITTPIHKETGKPFTGRDGYLDPNLVPASIRNGEDEDETPESVADHEFTHHLPSPNRRARHGRPPSKWLRSLHADELHIWLKTVDVPEAGVEGMTYFTHLTRDHYFDAKNVESLSLADQAKLHGAAHHGY